MPLLSFPPPTSRRLPDARPAQSSLPARARITQGATMIIVVLFTLLLLAGVLAASLRLGLSSRQTTADQASTLRAQYAAESNVSLVRGRLRDYQAILTTSGTDATGNVVYYLQLPTGTTSTTVEASAKAYCGQSGNLYPWVPTSEFATPREASDADVFPLAVQCMVNGTPTANNYGILADAVKPVAYTRLPASERPAVGADRAALMNWWNNNLGNITLGNAKYNIKPLRVVRLSPFRYRFYVGVLGASVKGDAGRGERYLTGSRTNNGDWWFEVLVPNPFDNVLFINQWLAQDGGFYNDIIDGDFFTNQKVRMLFGSNMAVFKGKVRSVGCTAFPASGAALGTDCTKSGGPGFYGNYTTPVTPSSSTNGGGPEAVNADLKSKLQAQGTTFSDPTSGSVSFTENYIPLPINGLDQKAQAGETGSPRGILLTANETGVELVAGDSNGNALSTYNGSSSKWSEPNPTYQYIRVKGDTSKFTYDVNNWLEVDKTTYSSLPISQVSTQIINGKTTYRVRPKVVDNSREFRYGSDKILYTKVNGTWTSTGKPFNGVIYSDTKPEVSGPVRKDVSLTADVSKMPPALASFATINVTGAQGITVNTDLTMSDTPCDNGGTQTSCPKTGDAEPKNAVVLFAPSGDVVMSKFTQSEATYHAAIMASQGAFNVENYNTRRVQGARHVIGSVVEDRYGLNGTASLQNGNVIFGNGYGDDFSFDNRLRKDILPSSPIRQVWQMADAGNTQKRMANLTWKQTAAGDY